MIEIIPAGISPGWTQLTLAHLEAGVRLVDHIDATLATHDATIFMALFRGA
jgi:hypothetical protein